MEEEKPKNSMFSKSQQQLDEAEKWRQSHPEEYGEWAATEKIKAEETFRQIRLQWLFETQEQQAPEIFSLDHANGLPDELKPKELAELMAGGHTGKRKEKFKYWLYRISKDMKGEGKTLETETRKKATIIKEPTRMVITPGIIDHWGTVFEYREAAIEWPSINRKSCVAWLQAIGMKPPRHIREWLGAELQQEKPDSNLPSNRQVSDVSNLGAKSSIVPMKEPQKKDDWFHALRVCIRDFEAEESRTPTEVETWARLRTNPPGQYAITSSKDRGKECLLFAGESPLDREAFGKRYKRIYPSR